MSGLQHWWECRPVRQTLKCAWRHFFTLFHHTIDLKAPAEPREQLDSLRTVADLAQGLANGNLEVFARFHGSLSDMHRTQLESLRETMHSDCSNDDVLAWALRGLALVKESLAARQAYAKAWQKWQTEKKATAEAGAKVKAQRAAGRVVDYDEQQDGRAADFYQQALAAADAANAALKALGFELTCNRKK